MSYSVTVSSSSPTQATTAPTSAAMQKRKQGFDDLTNALKDGDLDKAKAAYAALQVDAPGKANGKSDDANNPMAQIGKALDGGDMAGAQQAMAGMRGHHGHHGKGGGAGAAPTAATSSPRVSAPTATLGNNVNVMA